MYNYGYPAYYNSPYMQTYQQPQQAAQPAQSGIQWVQGEAGAKAYTVSTGQSVLLMDSESQSFYIKSTDCSGMPLPLRIFDYTERTAQNAQREPVNTPIDTSLFVTRSEFEERIAALTAPTAREVKQNAERTISITE